jgi:hypothetical protein
MRMPPGGRLRSPPELVPAPQAERSQRSRSRSRLAAWGWRVSGPAPSGQGPSLPLTHEGLRSTAEIARKLCIRTHTSKNQTLYSLIDHKGILYQVRRLHSANASRRCWRGFAASLELERRPAVWTGRTRIEKGGDWLLEELPLEGAEELFGRPQGHPAMLDALRVLVEGDDIGDGLFITLIVTDDELQFDTHTGASPGSSDR